MMRSGLALRKAISLLTLAAFLLTSSTPGVGQVLPAPGSMVLVSAAYVPPLIKGLTLHPKDPLRFDFIVDTGSSGISGQELERESSRLIKYFLAAL